MISWPQTLIQDLARRRAVVYLGSGISRNCANATGRRPKTWEELLRTMSRDINPNRHINHLINEKDYLTACEIVKKALGVERFNQFLRDEFLTPGYQHAPIHESIFKLDSRIVATPNFDKVYETYANQAAHGTIVMKHHYDSDIAEAIRGTERMILKVHGNIDNPDRLIFTRKEYAAAREQYRNFYSILEALALTHTFLFLGCGIYDPDIRLLLEDTFFKHPSSRSHIFVIPRGIHKSIVNILEESMNLSILTYSSINNHTELLDSVTQLGALVESERELLKTNANW